MLEQRIMQLQERLRAAQVVDAKDVSTDVVGVGSIVHIKDEKRGKSRQVHDRGLGRGQPGGEQALQRVAGRQGADGPQARREVACRAERPARKLKITKIDVGLWVAAMSGDDEQLLARAARRPGAPSSSACARGDRSVPARLPGRRADRRRA